MGKIRGSSVKRNAVYKELDYCVLFFREKYKKSMEEAYNLSVAINNNLRNYDTKLRPNAGGAFCFVLFWLLISLLCHLSYLWSFAFVAFKKHVSADIMPR